MVNVYATKDLGRCFIGIDKYYQGDVATYNTRLSRFFSGLFGLSENVTIAGKKWVVNKKSYLKFLSKFQQNSSFNSNFDSWITSRYKQIGTKKMSEVISKKKSKKLFEKLALAAVFEDVPKFKKYLGMGADLTSEFRVFEKAHMELVNARVFNIEMYEIMSRRQKKPTRFDPENFKSPLNKGIKVFECTEKKLVIGVGTLLTNLGDNAGGEFGPITGYDFPYVYKVSYVVGDILFQSQNLKLQKITEILNEFDPSVQKKGRKEQVKFEYHKNEIKNVITIKEIEELTIDGQHIKILNKDEIESWIQKESVEKFQSIYEDAKKSKRRYLLTSVIFGLASISFCLTPLLVVSFALAPFFLLYFVFYLLERNEVKKMQKRIEGNN